MPLPNFPHGVYWSDVPTAERAPITVDPGLAFVNCRAPVHSLPAGTVVGNGPPISWSASGYQAVVNVPILCNSLQDVQNQLGFSLDFADYGASEHADAAFIENNVAPVIYNNLMNPFTDSTAKTNTVQLTNGQAQIGDELVLASLIVSASSGSGAAVYVDGVDYLVGYNDQTLKTSTLTVLSTGSAAGATSLYLKYSTPNPANVTATRAIGGTDSNGNYTGLSVVENCFAATGLVPAIILCPEFSTNPLVASVMIARASLINQRFSAVAFADVDTAANPNYTTVSAWKNTNNYVSKWLAAFWPMGSNGSKTWHLSTLAAALCATVDGQYQNLPMASPSNNRLPITGLVLANGQYAPILALDSANFLNYQGIITAVLNQGWKLWGNFLTAYPSDSDVHDMWLPVRRMFNFIGNTLVLTAMQFVDTPGAVRQIESVTETVQLFLNSLKSFGALIAGTVEFLQGDNPTANLLNGNYAWHLYLTVPLPMQAIQFLLEFDISQLAQLFTSSGIVSVNTGSQI